MTQVPRQSPQSLIWKSHYNNIVLKIYCLEHYCLDTNIFCDPASATTTQDPPSS